MAALYNEIDPYAAQWLRNLIKAGLIPDGEVNTHSIVDLRPSDVAGFDQCHFFAGIGGWSQALHLAGWAPDRPVWTGSCPCQPFSVAGRGAGIDDPRHLWPHFHRLIAACRPPVVMGEQVAGKAGYGWFDGVRADLERTGYSSRATDIPALAVNAPHIRQRLYWAALDKLANANGKRLEGAERRRSSGAQGPPLGHSVECSGGDLANADQGGRGRWPHDGDGERDGQAGGRHEGDGVIAGGGEDRFWSDAVWIAGSDGKARRTKPGLPLLAHGVSNRVGRLRAYGNAIVPPLAAEVVKALMETLDEA